MSGADLTNTFHPFAAEALQKKFTLINCLKHENNITNDSISCLNVDATSFSMALSAMLELYEERMLH